MLNGARSSTRSFTPYSLRSSSLVHRSDDPPVPTHTTQNAVTRHNGAFLTISVNPSPVNGNYTHQEPVYPTLPPPAQLLTCSTSRRPMWTSQSWLIPLPIFLSNCNTTLTTSSLQLTSPSVDRLHPTSDPPSPGQTISQYSRAATSLAGTMKTTNNQLLALRSLISATAKSATLHAP